MPPIEAVKLGTVPMIREWMEAAGYILGHMVVT